jgi:hypothetical protein
MMANDFPRQNESENEKLLQKAICIFISYFIASKNIDLCSYPPSQSLVYEGGAWGTLIMF